MHELLAETYVKKAKAYEMGDAPIPGTAKQISFALVSVARQRDAVAEKLARILKSYDAEVFMRTADMHPLDCECLRCAVDAAR